MTRLLCCFLLLLFSCNVYGRTFCSPDENGNCDYQKYAIEIIPPLAAGIVLAALSLISFVVFFSGRFCCNCFGGRDRSAGICCTRREDFEGYSRGQVISVKVLVIFCACVFAACAVVGYLGNRNVGNGATSMVDTIINTGEDLLARAESIGDELKTLEYTQDIAREISDVVENAKVYLVEGQEIQSQVHEYNNYRFIALIIAFALPLLLLILGVLAAIFNLRRIALIAGLLCFLCSFFIWISGGLHFLIYEVSQDVCTEIDDYFTQNSTTNTNATSGVNLFLSCSSGGGFGAYQEVALKAINESNFAACDSITQLCNATNSQNCPNFQGSNCTSENLNKLDSIMISDLLVGCNRSGIEECPTNRSTCPSQFLYVCSNESISLRNCSISCRNMDIKKNANHTIFYIDLRQKYQRIFDQEIRPLLSCDTIKAGIDTVRTSLCSTVKRALFNVAIASFVLGVFLVPATILLIVGFKRFRPTGNTDDETQDHDDVPLEHKSSKGDVVVTPTYTPSASPSASPEPARKNDNESEAAYMVTPAPQHNDRDAVTEQHTQIVIISADGEVERPYAVPSKQSSPSSSSDSEDEKPPGYQKRTDSFSGIDQTIIELSNDLDIITRQGTLSRKLPPPESPRESDDEDVRKKSEDSDERDDEKDKKQSSDSEDEKKKSDSENEKKKSDSEEEKKSDSEDEKKKSDSEKEEEKKSDSEEEEKRSVRSERSEEKSSSSSSSEDDKKGASEDENKESDEERAERPQTPTGSDNED